jgi:hypothetical protein
MMLQEDRRGSVYPLRAKGEILTSESSQKKVLICRTLPEEVRGKDELGKNRGNPHSTVKG